MIDQIDLRALAEHSGPERAFVSLYLAKPDGLEALSQRIRRIRHLLAGNEAEGQHFEESLNLIRNHLEDGADFGPAGLCVFACWADDYLQAIPLPRPVSDLLWIDSSPYIRPLAEMQDEYENFVAVVADNSVTRIFFVTAATVDEDKRVRGDVKNQVKVGGWSQKRYERRRDKALHHYAREIADALADLDARERFDRLVLIGSQETLGEIRDVLPEPMRARVAGERTLDVHDEDAVWEGAYGLFFEEERAEEAALWDRIRDAYFRGGRAALGPEDVLEAAAVGRVAHMIVTRDAEIRGVRCRSCENLSAGTPTTCPVCGADDVFAEDLVNELVELLARSSAETEFTDPIDGLADVGHVAALLRY